MSYVGAAFDYSSDKVLVWERTEEGRQVFQYDPPRYFYVLDDDGQYTSIHGDKLSRLDFDTDEEFRQAARRYNGKTFESDIAPMWRVLMDEYYEAKIPDVHYALLDIENDYSSLLGYATIANPYAPINAVTIYQSWTKEYKVYAVPPPNWEGESTFDEEVRQSAIKHKVGFTPKVVLCRTERELLSHLVNDIQDADIISGWNSEFFDIPYIIKRLKETIPHLVNKMSFVGARPPREGTVNRFGQPEIVYKLSGRTHLDYLDLFKKFTFEGRTSYSLANIAANELDIPKLDYDGTLEELYKGTNFPPVDGKTWEDAEALPQEIDQLNLKRAILLEEIKKRGLKQPA